MRRGLNVSDTRSLAQVRVAPCFSTIMSTPTASQVSSISQHLRAAKNILQDAIFGAGYVWCSGTRRVGGLMFMFSGLLPPWMMLR